MAQQRGGRRRRLLAVLGTLAVAGGRLVLGVGDGFSAQAATTAKPAPEDCIAYDPNNLALVDVGAGQFRLQDGPLFMQVFANAADAKNGLSVAKGFNRQCFVG